MKTPTEDKHMHSKTEFLEELAVLLAGYVTERELLGDITTGATSDLRRATSLARHLITDYGMSEKLGPRTFGEKEEMIFLGREIHEQRDYSERIAEKIDDEIADFIEKAVKQAKAVVFERKGKLEEVVAVLMDKETLEKEAFDKIVGEKPKES